jgi:hypothetical protein
MKDSEERAFETQAGEMRNTRGLLNISVGSRQPLDCAPTGVTGTLIAKNYPESYPLVLPCLTYGQARDLFKLNRLRIRAGKSEQF